MQQKSLVVRKLGWKRVVRNLARFGWELDDAVQHTHTQIKTRYDGNFANTTKTKKIRIHLEFLRFDEKFENLSSVSALEFLYNFIFVIRRIIGTLLPFTLIMLIPPIGPFIGGLLFGQDRWSIFIVLILGCVLGWAILMLLENIFSFIAGKKLKLKSK